MKKGTRWIAVGAMGTFVAITAAGDRLVFAAQAQAQAPHVATHTEAAQAPGTRSYEIEEGSLESVLTRFRETSGVRTILARPEFATLSSPGIRGVYSVDRALQVILAGTGLTPQFTSTNTVTIDLAEIRETIDVSTTPYAAVLSSPKYTEPLRNIPQTITVIPESIIEQQGATTLRDVLKNVTGISIQAGEGGVPAGDNLSIRGFSARTDIFVDGVRDTGSYSRDAFNLQQVEVAKGPSSSYTGRGSTGGSINLVSKTPGASRLRSVSLSGGSPSYQRATFDINEPIKAIKGTSFRLNGMFTNSNSPGRNGVEARRWGLAPSLAFGLGSRTSVVLGYNHLDTDNVPDYGSPWVPDTNAPLAAWANQAPPVSFNNFYGLRSRDFEKTFTRIGTVDLNHYFDNSLVLRSAVRYGRTKRDSVIASPRFANTTSTTINRQLQSRDQFDDIATSQTNLTALTDTGPFEHTLIGGLEISREASENFARSGPATTTTDLFNPDPYQSYSGPITRTGANTKAVGRTTAVYAGDTVKFADHWQVTGSLRWDHFNLDYKTTAANGAVTPFERTDKMLSGRAAVLFKPTDSGSVYFGYGTSLNPSAEGLSLTTSTADLKPEKSRSFEAGTKWDLAVNRLSINAALFRTEKTNARTPGINPGDPPTVLDGREIVNGVEFGVTGNVTDRLQTIASYTFMRSRIDRSNESVIVGREFSNTPGHSFNVWSNYRFPRGFNLGGGVTYTGARYNNTNNSRRLAEGYWVADASAAYPLTEQLTLRLNVSNLTNTRYIDRIGGGHFVPGPGRMAMLTADFGF
jgi:catecholate siderophore receptor